MDEGAHVDQSGNPLDCLMGPLDDVVRIDQGSSRKVYVNASRLLNRPPGWLTRALNYSDVPLNSFEVQLKY